MAVKRDPYIKDERQFEQHMAELRKKYKEITLPPEYNRIIQEDSLRLLIMLARYKFIARSLRKEDEVLEIGCGSGIGSIFLGQYCRLLKGIDSKEGAIKTAKNVNGRDNVSFEMADFFNYSQDAKYDVIVAVDVIEHMPKSTGRRLVYKAASQLRSSGMFIIGTPSRYSYKYQGELSRDAHIKLYDQQELARLVEEYYGRVISFSMNDELVHTGFSKLAWYYFFLAFAPKAGNR